MLRSVPQRQVSLIASMCSPACLQRHFSALLFLRLPISFAQDTPGCRLFSLVLPTGTHSSLSEALVHSRVLSSLSHVTICLQVLLRSGKSPKGLCV